MPRKTKEPKELENEELSTTKTTSTNKKSSSSAKKSISSTKKTSSKSTDKKTEKVEKAEKDISTKKVKDIAESEKAKKSTKSTKSKKDSTVSTKKASAKTSAKSTSKTAKKSTTKTSTRAKKSVSVLENESENESENKSTVSTEKSDSKNSEIVEYYDLPYRYNQTVVKLLAQTPTNLFVYWDISDADKENFKKQYGYDFFEKTRPFLIVHNDTMNYSFEVEINDFANCWYLHVNDSNCDYHIELGRKPVIGYVQNWKPSEEDLKNEDSEINKYPSRPIDRDYFYITTSNQLESPNDHILFNKYSAPQSIQIRNVKTNAQYSKPISALSFINNMHKFYNIYDLYRELYKEENVDDIFDLNNPSSGNPSSGSFSSKFK